MVRYPRAFSALEDLGIYLPMKEADRMTDEEKIKFAF